jgi:phage gp46-like protein
MATTPLTAVLTLDGRALETLPLLPEDGEPGGYILARAAWLSLLCRARDDSVDDGQDPPDRGGWWGDTCAATCGDQFGSTLWTIYRTRGDDLAPQTEEAVKAALAWLVEDGHAEAIECSCVQSGERLDATIRVRRGAPAGDIRLDFDLWEGFR